MTPGYGYGGPCYPRDNQALALYAQKIGVNPCIPLATHEYNEFHHSCMAEALKKEAREEYIFEDVAYKPKCAVAMIDESPKLRVALQLAHEGCKVVIRDRIAVSTRIFVKLNVSNLLSSHSGALSLPRQRVCGSAHAFHFKKEPISLNLL
jgi:UDP-glucose 6-dehydrogenase